MHTEAFGGKGTLHHLQLNFKWLRKNMFIQREMEKYGGISTIGESGEGHIGLLCSVLEIEIFL